MAGKAPKRNQDDPKTVKELYDLWQASEQELERLRPLIANINPASLSNLAPEPLLAPNDETYEKLLALGIAGFTPAEMRTTLGINSIKHFEWMRTISPYKLAFTRARDTAYMAQMRRIRLAVGAKDWKFPYQNAVKMLAVMMETDEMGNDIGDASELIVLNTG